MDEIHEEDVYVGEDWVRMTGCAECGVDNDRDFRFT
jgi:hypothetical protein